MVDHSVSATKILQSVVVTGSGNSVSLTFGTSGLVLPLDRKQIRSPERRRTQAAGERQRELDILDPSRSRLPLIGREAVLADLRGWLVDEPDISVHALTGKAGTGKTRLAIELCAAIDGGQEPGELGRRASCRRSSLRVSLRSMPPRHSTGRSRRYW